MVFAREAEPPIPASAGPAKRRPPAQAGTGTGASERWPRGPAATPQEPGNVSAWSGLRDHDRSPRGWSSWRCVVELPTRMRAAAVIGDAHSRDEAVADAFLRAEVALGWNLTGATETAADARGPAWDRMDEDSDRPDSWVCGVTLNNHERTGGGTSAHRGDSQRRTQRYRLTGVGDSGHPSRPRLGLEGTRARRRPPRSPAREREYRDRGVRVFPTRTDEGAGGARGDQGQPASPLLDRHASWPAEAAAL